MIHKILDLFRTDEGRLKSRQLDYIKQQLARPLPIRECSVCEYTGQLTFTGYPIRLEGRCPQCDALERHRLFALWIRQNTGQLAGRRILHFAPEDAISGMLRPIVEEHVTCDISPDHAELVIDIENIELADTSFDVIVCFHVLEHVDDTKALAELKRILKPGGKLLLMVPIIEGWDDTYENPSISTPEGRAFHFGQSDHVRYYGADFRDRVRSAGFQLDEFTAQEPEAGQYGLLRGEKLFIAMK